MKTRKNNKGFSLVELIVVVAIMAVLVGILAPAYLKYVENSRASKDAANAQEIVHAVEVAITEETVYNATTLPLTLTVVDGGDLSGTGASALITEVNTSIDATGVNFTSKKYNGKTLTITIANDSKVTYTLPANY